jgi:glycosyltransferase involved in cell wall biosynthesis
MNKNRLRVVLATDSLNPSGMGEHMLTLVDAFQGEFDVVLAALDESGLIARAARRGLAVKAMDDMPSFERWLRSSDVSLLHVHAGIGWEGHMIARAGVACAIPVIRTEHLPYLLTDRDQKDQFQRHCANLAHHIVVSQASRTSFEANNVAPDKLTVVTNGIVALDVVPDSERVRSELGLGSKTILLTVARFTAQKDHASLIRAMPAILAEILRLS